MITGRKWRPGEAPKHSHSRQEMTGQDIYCYLHLGGHVVTQSVTFDLLCSFLPPLEIPLLDGLCGAGWKLDKVMRGMVLDIFVYTTILLDTVE
jgi:hypothetical protein